MRDMFKILEVKTFKTNNYFTRSLRGSEDCFKTPCLLSENNDPRSEESRAE